MRLGLSMRQPNGRTPIQRAIASLRARGSDAHLWLPGGDVKTYGPELVTGDFTIAAGGTNTIANISGYGAKLSVVCNAISGLYVYDLVSGGWAPLGTKIVVSAAETHAFYNSNGSPVTLLPSQLSVREITSITSTLQNGLTTGNYLESTGNTLATVDNPTGLVLDALGSVGSELSSYAASPQTTSGAISTVLSASLVVGKTYKVSYTARSTGSVQIGVLTGAYGWQSGNPATVASATDVTASFIFVASDTVGRSAIYPVSGTAVATVSVREVTGIHLTQGTTANKPLLRRGLVNLALQSQSFASPWEAHPNYSGASGVITNSGNSTTPQGLFQQLTGGGNGVYTIAVEASQGTCSSLLIAVEDNATDAVRASQVFALTGTETIYCVTGTTAGVAPGVRAKVGTNGVTGTINAKVGIFQGSYTASDIIKNGGIPVTTSAAASNPDAGRYSWAFDGSNDSLALGSVSFQQAEDHYVTAAFSVNAIGVQQTVFSCSSTATSIPLICDVEITATGYMQAFWRDDANIARQLTGVVMLTPSARYVVTAAKIGVNRYLWLNGVLVGTNTQGALGATTTNISTIGALCRITVSNYLNGTIYYINPVKGTLTESDRKLVEALAANAAGITL